MPMLKKVEWRQRAGSFALAWKIAGEVK